MSDNLEVAKECGAEVVIDADWYECNAGEITFNDKTQLEAYTARILASQQAAHDAEIAKYDAALTQNDRVIVGLHAATAIKNEALRTAYTWLNSAYSLPPQTPDARSMLESVRNAFSTSPESLAAWEAEKLLPIKRILVSWREDHVSDAQLCDFIDQFTKG